MGKRKEYPNLHLVSPASPEIESQNSNPISMNWYFENELSPDIPHSAYYLSNAIDLHSKDSLVKLKIMSLIIPELSIEAPETATVGLLKDAVKEAVTALICDGFHIQMSVQGKKVRDDNTIAHIGLSCRENPVKTGFILEPGPESIFSENPVFSMSTNSTNLLQSLENNLELVPYRSHTVAKEQPSVDSRAIVIGNERPMISQRKIRRPFSVIEVEYLVQAVEELGIGRWRDVKLRHFENANHRTYVDLKDKWKSLVHTANILPQQRRGEAIPQGLLDRVLQANRYIERNREGSDQLNMCSDSLKKM